MSKNIPPPSTSLRGLSVGLAFLHSVAVSGIGVFLKLTINPEKVPKMHPQNFLDVNKRRWTTWNKKPVTSL
jgi:hypothetical protein